MRVRRSLTIKQMAAVSGVAVVTLCIFITIQLFHLVQQRREDYAQQLEQVAHAIRQPLAEAVLNVDLPQARGLLNTFRPLGIVTRADVVLPNNIQVLHGDFPAERPVPALIANVFSLPVRISVPLYTLERMPAHPKPLAYLVLQADSFRLYQQIRSIMITLLATFLLMALVLSVAVSWCMNRLMVHPLRRIARELEALDETQILHHQLPVPPLHKDDELGMLTRHYNRNQQTLARRFTNNPREWPRHPVTALPNDALFTELLAQYLRFRPHPPRFNVLLVGVETLQEVAGVLSEAQRNAMLRTLVERLHSELTDNDELGQFGPTEFSILARDTERPFQAMRLARRIMAALNAPLTEGELTVRPVASIGIAHYSGETALSAETLVLNARSALVSAHHQGKNQILFFEPELTRKTQQRLSQESDILQALEHNEFVLFLQPQIDLNTGCIAGAEALLRRQMPDGSFSLDADFIPFAEEIGLIVPLGYWVLEQGCRILADWQREGIELPLSVNLSGVQIQHRNFLLELKTLLSRYKIKPGTLVLEITETARIDDLDRALKLLAELHQSGVTVALDDFGMGYSSLEYLDRLRCLPVDIIKIDRSFTGSLPEDDVMVRIVNSIAHAMNISVIAEGVETPAQFLWLKENQVPVGQGYLFARPMPRNAFEMLLRRHPPYVFQPEDPDLPDASGHA
ncbi:biofilm formation regulator HmsP [Nissabacter sp. SGAir0207]|uniref:biofilm formation regulator HmsP n=1 Tax=Nissabacter sp. SGAir0207 TaxID=2126321 RepID=UPI0010CD2192|nr:biofilm formation regulator HmsP [Nissabacter sp. SGAir0207]QCR37752.1 biofilm formation regulator HmsP [Nissabacter sp. SGAir0207]